MAAPRASAPKYREDTMSSCVHEGGDKIVTAPRLVYRLPMIQRDLTLVVRELKSSVCEGSSTINLTLYR